jgi:chromosome segregation ATPase
MIRSTKDLLNRKNGVSQDVLPPMSNRVSERAQGILKLLDSTPSPPPSALPVAVAAPRRKSLQDDDNGVDDLRRRVESQKAELDNRTDSVNAIQRNFQRLSEMYSSDRQKLVNAESEIARLHDELCVLRAEKKLFSALQSEFTILQVDHGNNLTTLENERKLSETRVKKLEELLRGAERETKMLGASLNLAARESQARLEDNQRIHLALQTVENSLNALLLSGMELQKKVVAVAISDGLRSEALKSVGCGIAFVATHGSVDPQESEALRLEVIAKALDNCSRDCFGSLETTLFVNMSDAKSKMLHLEIQRDDACRLHLETSVALESVKSQLESNLKSIEHLEDAQRRLTSENSSLTLELSDLRNSSMKLNDNSAEVARQKALVEQLIQDLAKIKKENKTLESAVGHLEAELSDSKSREADSLQALNGMKEDLTTDMQVLRDQCETDAVSKKQMNDTIVALQSEISNLRASIVRRTESTNNTAKENENLLKARITSLENSLNETKAELRAVDSNRAVIRGEYEALCSEIAAMKLWAQNHTLKMESLEHESEIAQKKLYASEKQVTELMAERSQLLLDSHSSADSVHLLNSQLTQHRDTIAKLSNERALQESDIRRLKDELQRSSDSMKSLDGFRLKNQQQADEISELKSAILNASALSQLNHEKIQTLTKQIADSESKLANSIRELNRVQATQNSFDDQRQSLELLKKNAELRSRHLREVHEETLKTVKKLIHVEKACESGYSCLGCLQLLKDPVQCAPCGHTFCRRCFEEDSHNRDRKSQGKYCPECDECNVALLVPSKSLDLLTGKFQYRCQVLADLCAKLEKDASHAEPTQ